MQLTFKIESGSNSVITCCTNHVLCFSNAKSNSFFKSSFFFAHFFPFPSPFPKFLKFDFLQIYTNALISLNYIQLYIPESICRVNFNHFHKSVSWLYFSSTMTQIRIHLQINLAITDAKELMNFISYKCIFAIVNVKEKNDLKLLFIFVICDIPLR